MTSTKRLLSVALVPAVFALGTAATSAQESPAPATSPAPIASPTLMDRAYDGQTHVTLAPYLWLPTIRSNFQYRIPKLPAGAGAFATNVQVGPSDYLTNLNSGGSFAVNVRKGDFEFLGDYLFVNASTNATFFGKLSGPQGRITIPATVTTNLRFVQSIWEAAAGISLAHGHNADANLFVGWRQYPITTNLAYTATVGSRVTLTRSGTIRLTPLTNDVIFGFNGKVFVSDHFFAPYYIDMGVGATQQTWQGYGGAGYAFNHGQTLVAVFRSLNYYGFSSSSPVQKLSMWGPLLGYTFGL